MNKVLLGFMSLTVLVPFSLALWVHLTPVAAPERPYSPILVPRGADMREWAGHCVGCHTKVECDQEVVEGLEQDMRMCLFVYTQDACVEMKKKAIKAQKSCEPRNTT